MKPRVFVSYSHADVDVVRRFLLHLRASDSIEVWDDGGIQTGELWRAKIQEAIAGSSVAVMLVSLTFLQSPFIRGSELTWLFGRRNAGELRLYPVILEP